MNCAGGGPGCSSGACLGCPVPRTRIGYQHILHRNLIYLATIADATPPSTQKTVD
ncbi:PREDICTED: SS18-like protein 2 [Nipponia nippon]|uniref:SS18-like protein 2 n=1 Tax=Nipponia nippon TaxID=128390 RepID=UPI0005115055|nr:PREDICTED: SS18-like protein 2 [Nipponia nippon]